MSVRSTTRLISRKHVKGYALAVAKLRAHQFTRVGNEFYTKVEANVRDYIHHYVRSLPSRGKTIT